MVARGRKCSTANGIQMWKRSISAGISVKGSENLQQKQKRLVPSNKQYLQGKTRDWTYNVHYLRSRGNKDRAETTASWTGKKTSMTIRLP